MKRHLAPLAHKTANPSSGRGGAGGRDINGLIENGARKYVRRRDLPGLIAMDPRQFASDDPALSYKIVSCLWRAMRVERQRGRAGHWTYDLNRHIALMQAYKAELKRYGARRQGGPHGQELSLKSVSTAGGNPPAQADCEIAATSPVTSRTLAKGMKAS